MVWNLSPLLAGDDDPRIEGDLLNVRRRADAFISKWKPREDWLHQPDALKEALDDYEDWLRVSGVTGDSWFYFHLRSAQDENDTNVKAKMRMVEEAATKVINDTQFFTLKLAKVPPEIQAVFLAAPDLARYRHFLERLFAESAYLLSEAEERILNLKSGPARDHWVRMTSGFLAQEEREVLMEDGTRRTQTFTEIQGLLESQKKDVRDSAGEAVNAILATHAAVAEAEINSILSNKKIDDELRGMPRPDIARHLADDIETAVVDALVETVAGRFDISRRYYALKAKLLGMPKLAYHERSTVYGMAEKKYNFDEAFALTEAAFEKLDPQFADILRRFREEGRLDVFPRKGKHGGAFETDNLLTQPTYVLLNHTDRLRDVLTLGHEMGHAINSELMRASCHSLDFGTSLATAEVASTFMEDFVLQEILHGVDDEMRLSLLVLKLNDEVATIFRQVACYRFETDLHREFRIKNYLSQQEIGAIFQRNMGAYLGDAVELSPGSENWWVYWSHIRTFFYVYSYASGLLISKNLQSQVKADHAAIEKVKIFLSAGLSDSPRGIFKNTGIDIGDAAFWQRGLEEVDALLQETEALAKKLGKL